MRRLLVVALVVVAAIALGVVTGPARATPPDCDRTTALCAEPVDAIGYGGAYTGHDEPSLLFYSNAAGSGNTNFYKLQIPSDPKVLPNQAGTAGTWNFQLHPAFWLGMALCDNQSAPEFTHAACAPDSDTNIFDGTDPGSRRLHRQASWDRVPRAPVLSAGWAPWPPGVSCDATKWCAAMAIFSLNQDQNTGTLNNAACLNSVGLEPANFAFITKSGVPHAPPGAARPDGGLIHAERGDRPVHGLGRRARDRHPRRRRGTDGDHPRLDDRRDRRDDGECSERLRAGPIRAGIARPAIRPVHVPPHVRDVERAHPCSVGRALYNVAFSDEIGHFEYCNAVTVEGGDCTSNGEASLDDDDTGCFSSAVSLLVQIGGCIGTDDDFDGVSYQPVWPGADPNRGQDKKLHPSSVLFTSPVFGAGQNYSRVAFEADLPRIEAADFGGNCDRLTGTNCVNPPPGANFYPIYTTGIHRSPTRRRTACVRILCLATRRREPEGDDEHVRRQFHRRVRAVALQLLPEPEPGRAAPHEQLPEHPRLESLPRVSGSKYHDLDEGARGRPRLDSRSVGRPCRLRAESARRESVTPRARLRAAPPAS